MSSLCLSDSTPKQSVPEIYSVQGCPFAEDSLQVDMRWYAVQTYSNREKVVDKFLKSQGVGSFLPLLKEKRNWSDRLKTIQMPLFPNYLFVHMNAQGDDYRKVVYSNNVCRILGDHTGPISVPDSQIADIKRVIESKSPLEVIYGLCRGQQIKIKSGPLKGMIGKYLQRQNGRFLAIHISMLGRTVLAMLNPCDVQPY